MLSEQIGCGKYGGVKIWPLLICFALTPHLSLASPPDKREIAVELEEIEGATLYEIELTRKDSGARSNKPIHFKMKKPLWRAAIAPGLYSIRLRSYDDRKVPGDWSPDMDYQVKVPAPLLVTPPDDTVLKAKGTDEDKVSLSWKASPGATAYRVEIHSDSGQVIRKLETKDLTAQVSLKVAAQYQWQVVGIQADQGEGDAPEKMNSFTLKGPQLSSPEIKKPRTPIVTQVEWKQVDHVEQYQYVLSRQNLTGSWDEISKGETKDTTLPFNLSEPSGLYRLQVRGVAPYRDPSPVAQMEFAVQGGLRSPAAVEQAKMKWALEKTSNYYFIASYFLTQMDYSSQDYDANAAGATSVLGGTGRLGLGHQAAEKPWGVFGIADLSGFNIAGRNYTFAALEAHGTWRWDIPGRGRMLLGYGIYSKELPLLQGTASGGFTGVGKISQYGLHAGAQYWLPWTYKLGMQFNGRVYTALGGTSPTGTTVDPSISYQFGALGSYRLTDDILGFAGYAYRLDQSIYGSLTGANKNSIQVEGHYLNLILEVSF